VGVAVGAAVGVYVAMGVGDGRGVGVAVGVGSRVGIGVSVGVAMVVNVAMRLGVGLGAMQPVMAMRVRIRTPHKAICRTLHLPAHASSRQIMWDGRRECNKRPQIVACIGSDGTGHRSR